MVARLYFNTSTTSNVQAEFRLRLLGWEVREQAEEGSVAMSTIALDDPDMDWDIDGHREAYLVEDESVSPTNVLWSGYVADQEIGRMGGEALEPLSRVWTLSLTDANTVWQRRIMVGADCKRPDETDVQRVAWLLSTAEAAEFDDVTTYVDTTNGFDMDAADYRYQSFSQIMDDCAQQSGRNWYAFATGSNRRMTAWYSFTSNTAYASDLSLSNDPDDWTDAELVDGSSLVWPISEDTKLRRDPGRVYSGVAVPYDGGTVYMQKNATAVAFARRDTTMPAVNVKTKAKAEARARRYLNDIDEQDETITTTVILPAAIATKLRAGMLVNFKATHLPGYETFVSCRVLACNIAPHAHGDRYRLTLELAPPNGHNSSTGGPVDGVLYVYRTGTAGNDGFARTGDNPGPGWKYRPTSPLLTPIGGLGLYRGWTVEGDGTLDIRFAASTTGVLIDNIPFTITWNISVNSVGVAWAQEFVAGHLVAYGGQASITALDVPVVAGDVIRASVTCEPPIMPFFRTPRGTGQGDEMMEIIGGSLS